MQQPTMVMPDGSTPQPVYQNTSAASAITSSFIPQPSLTASFIVSTAIRGVAGYFVGKLLGHPTAGAVATAALGLPGMLGVAIYAKHGGK